MNSENTTVLCWEDGSILTVCVPFHRTEVQFPELTQGGSKHLTLAPGNPASPALMGIHIHTHTHIHMTKIKT